jgi:small-conductance mechanosensitive channel
LSSVLPVRTIEPVSEELVRRDELHAAIEARRELGEELEPQVIDAFVERIEERIDRRLATRQVESEQALKRKGDHQKEMVLGAMGISVPVFVIAAIFAGLAGIIAVAAVIAVIAVVSAR